MVFNFEFSGGIYQPDNANRLEKFFLFFLIGDEEIPMYHLLRDGLVQRKQEGRDEFVTQYDIAKVFLSRQGFGIQRRFHSIYLRLSETGPVVSLFPFSGEAGGTGFRFKGRGSLMTADEILDLLPEDGTSHKFMLRQETLPINLMEKVVSIDNSESRKNVRVVRIGQKGERQ